MKNTVVDLCCGAGGFSLGAHRAGFSTVAAIDIDKDLTSSWEVNFPLSRVFHADIKELDENFWKEKLKGGSVEGVIGGPPCQGFSRIGKRDKSDPRNSLVVAFAEQVNYINPAFFVMENVEGILDENNKEALDSALAVLSKNYVVLNPMVMNASDFGAATNRKRVIVIGYKKGRVQPISESDFWGFYKDKVTVRDAIGDLPSPENALTVNEAGFSLAAYPTGSRLSHYAKKMREVPDGHVGDCLIKKHLSEGFVSGLNATKHTDEVIERFKFVVPGKVDRVSRFPRLQWDQPAPTLRAGTGKDKGSFQSVRPIHPESPRVITIREAARIQGFPDWFIFHPTIWHSFRMIGNSVSPIFAESILRVISSKLVRQGTTNNVIA